MNRTAEVPERSDVDPQVAFETLLSDISTRCANIASDNVDREISSALARVCQFFSIDFAALWQQPMQTNRLTLTHSHPPFEQLGAVGARRVYETDLQTLGAIGSRGCPDALRCRPCSAHYRCRPSLARLRCPRLSSCSRCCGC